MANSHIFTTANEIASLQRTPSQSKALLRLTNTFDIRTTNPVLLRFTAELCPIKDPYFPLDALRS